MHKPYVLLLFFTQALFAQNPEKNSRNLAELSKRSSTGTMAQADLVYKFSAGDLKDLIRKDSASNLQKYYQEIIANIAFAIKSKSSHKRASAFASLAAIFGVKYPSKENPTGLLLAGKRDLIWALSNLCRRVGDKAKDAVISTLGLSTLFHELKIYFPGASSDDIEMSEAIMQLLYELSTSPNKGQKVLQRFHAFLLAQMPEQTKSFVPNNPKNLFDLLDQLAESQEKARIGRYAHRLCTELLSAEPQSKSASKTDALSFSSEEDVVSQTDHSTLGRFDISKSDVSDAAPIDHD